MSITTFGFKNTGDNMDCYNQSGIEQEASSWFQNFALLYKYPNNLVPVSLLV